MVTILNGKAYGKLTGVRENLNQLVALFKEQNNG